MLGEIIPHAKARQSHPLLGLGIVLGLLASPQDGVPVQQRVGVAVGDAAEVVARDRVDDGLPFLDALLAVEVEDGVVGFPVPDAGEAVVQAADVDEPARDPHAAPRVAQVGGVGGQQDPAHAERRRAPLVHLVRRHHQHLVVPRLRVPR